jgi:syntaxin of plants SYP5
MDETREKLVYAEQEKYLDELRHVTTDLKHISIEINKTLTIGEKKITQLDFQVDSTTGRIKTATNKVSELILRNKDSISCFCIGLLVIMFVVLIVIVSL